MLNAPKTPRWRAWLLVAVACWAAVAPAFATAFASGFSFRGPETRVWNFFQNYGGTASDEGSQVADSHQGNGSYGYEIASGVHVYLYANADPVNREDPDGHFSLMEVAEDTYVVGTEVKIVTPRATFTAAKAVVAVAAAIVTFSIAGDSQNRISDTDLKRQNINSMRLQLQMGTKTHFWSVPYAFLEPLWVTKAHIYAGLADMFEAVMEGNVQEPFPKSAKGELRSAIIRMSEWVKGAPPLSGGVYTAHQEYVRSARIDLEQVHGTNFR